MNLMHPPLAGVIAGAGSDMFSCIAGGIGTAGPKHGANSNVRVKNAGGRSRGQTSTRVEKEVVIGSGHPVYTVSDPRNKIRTLLIDHCLPTGNMKMYDIAERLESTMCGDPEDVPQPRLVPAP
jgi:2-methylcitrate synthase